MPQLFSDGARSKLLSGITDSSTTLTLEDASAFPLANTGTGAVSDASDWFKVVIQDEAGFEIVYVRSRDNTSPNNLANVLRGQDGTTERVFAAEAVVGLRPVASDMASLLSRLLRTAPTAGPSNVTLNRVSGELASISFTLDGKSGTVTLTRSGGRLTQVLTAYGGKTRTETLNYTGNLLTSVTAVET